MAKSARRILIILLTLVLSACSLPGMASWFLEAFTVASYVDTPTNPILSDKTIPASPEPSAAIPQPTSGSNSPGAQYLVLISYDACRPEYLDLVELPNLEFLLVRGVSYTGAWVGALENNTPPGHTEMSTGTFPNHNGILGFAWGNRVTGEVFHPTTLAAINRDEMDEIVAKSGVPTLAGLIKEKYPQGSVAALSSHKYYAAQGLGVGPADIILYTKSEFLRPKDRRSSQPSIHPGDENPQQGYEPPQKGAQWAAALVGHEPEQDVLDDPRMQSEISDFGDDNTHVFHIAQVLFERYHPRALLINLPETDGWGHKTGGITDPESMRQIMQATDRALGELMDTYRKAGIFNQTLWVIVSDHGMSPNLHAIPTSGLLETSNHGFRENRMVLPLLRLNGPAQAIPLAEKIASSDMEGILGVYARIEVENGYSYQSADATKATLTPALDQAYLYLLGTFVGSYSPDVVVTTGEDFYFEGGKKNNNGAHNTITWGNQHIVLIFSGPGITKGKISDAPARLVDILPTIARLMQLPGDGMDGIVLGDALVDPTLSDLQYQAVLNDWLSPLRDALRSNALGNAVE